MKKTHIPLKTDIIIFILLLFQFTRTPSVKAEKAMAPYSSTLAWKIPWRRSLVGCSPWGHEESDTTERLHFHFSLSCIGEGHGNPLQCSCLENPRDRGAWWAAVCGVTQSQTRLKRLSILLVRLQIGTASKEISMEFPLKKLKIELHMIQQFHSWIYIQRKWKH